jgi:phage gpG-like protein
VYISGYTDGSLGGSNAGPPDAFLTKYDASGVLEWSRQIGTPSYDYSNSVAVDGAGGVYISGHAWGSLGGPTAGDYDAFLVKYDASGVLQWSRQIGTSSQDGSYSVAADGAGGVYITGWTKGGFGEPNAGYDDAFLVKYDDSGNLLWSRQLGTSSYDYGNSVAVDGAGGVYISGHTWGSLGGPNAGGCDAFLVKYVVPEPATLSLLALGGLMALRRRR